MSVVAPGGTGPEAGTHRTDATGGTAGGTGSSLGLSSCSATVESTSFLSPGFNFSTNELHRSAAGAAGMVRLDQLVGLSVASLLIHPHLQLRASGGVG